MSDIDTVTQMLRQVAYYRLDGWSYVSQYTKVELAMYFNGIGPEWFPERLRNEIDARHPDLLPVAFIHDTEWSTSDGTRKSFDASNERFKCNGYKIARAKYCWWDPRRYIRMNQARVFGNLCQAFGWSAYRAAYEKQTKGK